MPIVGLDTKDSTNDCVNAYLEQAAKTCSLPGLSNLTNNDSFHPPTIHEHFFIFL
jgi:hypothetical protein